MKPKRKKNGKQLSGGSLQLLVAAPGVLGLLLHIMFILCIGGILIGKEANYLILATTNLSIVL
jgi:hypothetical protein